MLKHLSFDEWSVTEKRGLETQILRLTRDHIVTFIYRKLGGDFRVFAGTRNLNLVPRESQPKGSRQLANSLNSRGIFNIYDIDVEDWRRFYMNRAIRIISVEDADGNRVPF